VFQNPKGSGSVSKIRKGMVLLNPKWYGYVKTRKGLVTNVLDASLDLSSYMYV